MDAVKYLAGNTISVKKYHWVIEGDISSYFNTLCQRKLLKLLRRRLKDEKILRLISKFLHAGVMEGKLFKATNSGVPQGGIRTCSSCGHSESNRRLDCRSRMRREFHVRFYEGVGVRFPRATRLVALCISTDGFGVKGKKAQTFPRPLEK